MHARVTTPGPHDAHARWPRPLGPDDRTTPCSTLLLGHAQHPRVTRRIQRSARVPLPTAARPSPQERALLLEQCTPIAWSRNAHCKRAGRCGMQCCHAVHLTLTVLPVHLVQSVRALTKRPCECRRYHAMFRVAPAGTGGTEGAIWAPPATCGQSHCVCFPNGTSWIHG